MIMASSNSWTKQGLLFPPCERIREKAVAMGKKRVKDSMTRGHRTPILYWKLSVTTIMQVCHLPVHPDPVKAK